MKSLLQEAATVDRAVERAWKEAGKPKEFTVKVHDEGERNFFGMVRRPAAVSIMYVAPRDEKDRGRRGRTSRISQSKYAPKKDARPVPSATPTTHEVEVTHAWESEWKQLVVGNVREIARLMSMHVPFDVSIDDKILTIKFRRNLLEDADEQRMLFASLSYLSIQFLKRQFRNRFTGYRIVVTCKDAPVESVREKGGSDEKESTARRGRKKTARKSDGDKASSDGEVKKERRERKDRSGKGKSSSKRVVRTTPSDDSQIANSIVEEQIRFAQQQLEIEEAQNAAQKAEKEFSAPSENKDKEDKPAPKRASRGRRDRKESAPQDAPAADVKAEVKEEKAVDQTSQEDAKASPQRRNRSTRPKKKEKQSYRAFYVMPEKDGNGK